MSLQGKGWHSTCCNGGSHVSWGLGSISKERRGVRGSGGAWTVSGGRGPASPLLGTLIKGRGGRGGSRPVDSAHQPGHACMGWISHAQGKGIETHAHTHIRGGTVMRRQRLRPSSATAQNGGGMRVQGRCRGPANKRVGHPASAASGVARMCRRGCEAAHPPPCLPPASPRHALSLGRPSVARWRRSHGSRRGRASGSSTRSRRGRGGACRRQCSRWNL